MAAENQKGWRAGTVGPTWSYERELLCGVHWVFWVSGVCALYSVY